MYEDLIEKEIVLEHSLLIKEKLESLGYKVFITRDNNEDDWGIKKIYTKDGRINTLYKTNAKLILSIHANSAPVIMHNGGIEDYAAHGSDTTFASSIAKNIVEKVNTTYSPNKEHLADTGVYTRYLTEQDIKKSGDDLIKKGYTPYDILPKTTYYYIVR